MSPFPPGHFYSPVIDAEELRSRQERLWPTQAPETPGVDFRHDAQIELLKTLAPLFAEYNFPGSASTEPEESAVFTDINPFFAGLDSRLLFALLRHLRPRRLIEVGSGYSSLLTAAVNEKHLAGKLELTLIEPYPQPFLTSELPGLKELIGEKVQDVALKTFEALQPGDILFVDSSHVSKTGSDVNYLYFEVFPRLPPGVIIHIHDIFLPYDYPKQWVLEEERSWNEQYLLLALLQHTTAYEVLIGSAYAFFTFPDIVERIVGTRVGGGSFWMKRR